RFLSIGLFRFCGVFKSAEPGENVTLRCGDTNINKDLDLQWRRLNEEWNKYVFFYWNNSVHLDGQHESFRNRVFPEDSQMKDGDSVVLTNVTINDNGIYQCFISKHDGLYRGWKMILNPEILKAEPGENVTLRCEDTNMDEIFLLEWIKPNLWGEETVFLYRSDGILFEAQPESYRNRVFLKNSQMKDGDLSVVLKNVTSNDNGTYECRVRQMNALQRGWTLISIIYLSVSITTPKFLAWLVNVTLRCEDKNINGMFHLKWIRPNLQRDEIVFLYWNDEVPPFQHESFQNRVFLKNRQMKDGDLSVVLKNVTINDSGIYDCKEGGERDFSTAEMSSS
uniref:Ig-like domain-containing protein n=1 Tax=Oryzias melastigma TaxID=30732 RepID=A0A3B3BNC5_ORYME